jgi:hypothetical protein
MSYYEIISWTGSTLTLIIQLYILYLIQFKCSKHIDDYAYFLTLLLVSYSGRIITNIFKILGVRDPAQFCFWNTFITGALCTSYWL